VVNGRNPCGIGQVRRPGRPSGSEPKRVATPLRSGRVRRTIPRAQRCPLPRHPPRKGSECRAAHGGTLGCVFLRVRRRSRGQRDDIDGCAAVRTSPTAWVPRLSQLHPHEDPREPAQLTLAFARKGSMFRAFPSSTASVANVPRSRFCTTNGMPTRRYSPGIWRRM